MYSLNDFLVLLESQKQLIRISREVDPVFEAPALIKKIQKTTNKAVLFEKIKGYKDPLASNVLGSLQRVSMILGCRQDQINEKWNLMEQLAKSASGQRAAATEKSANVRSECSLSEIPLLHYCEKDSGKYITAGMVYAKDPQTGTGNLSFHRMEYVSDNKLRLRITPGNHLETIQRKAEEKGLPLEIAIMIGGYPAYMLAGASRIPYHHDELDLAAAIIKQPQAQYQCLMVDLVVPAAVDYLIEAVILPEVREEEGPFGDFFGYYVPIMKNHVVSIRRVTRLKENCCAYAILAGSTEQDILAGVPLSANIYNYLKGIFVDVVDVTVMSPLYHSVVKINQKYSGQAMQVGYAALSCDPSQTKYCTVVDEDVDIYDPADVIWAAITRCSPENDISIMHRVPSFRRDPHKKFWGKMVYDATKPLDPEAASEFERTSIPGYEDICLEDYL
jgi:UbiD family decarboxylase